MDDLVSSVDPSGLSQGYKIGGVVLKAFKKYQEYRTSVFLRTVDTRYEQMTEDERVKFKDAINGEYGQKITSDFAIAVAMTPSSTVNAALGLLYAKDPEFNFTESQIERFVVAVSGLTDRKVEFYLRLFDILPSNPDIQPYPIWKIDQDNHSKVSQYADQDEVFIYIYDFLSRGLVITADNNTNSNTMGFGRIGAKEQVDWKVTFCLSNTHKRYGALLRKANELMK